jgi:hypothetical protein
VATYTQANSYGASFQAVGVVDARHLQGSNVIMAPDKATALADYAQQLAGSNTAGSGPSSSGKQTTLTGTLARISPATENGSTVYYMTLTGQTAIFKAAIALSPELPLAQPGDTVSISYFATGQSVETLTAFSDSDVTGGTATATPNASPQTTPIP